MTKMNIEQIAKEHGGQVYDYAEDGILLVNKTGKEFKHLDATQVNDVENQSSVIDFFSHEPETSETNTDDPETVALPCAFIDVKCNDIENEKKVESLLNHAKSFNDEYLVYLRFHFDVPPKRWADTFSLFFNRAQSVFGDSWPIFHLCGPFAKVSDADKEFLFGQGFRLYYEHVLDFNSTTFSQKERDYIADLSEFGFRLPILWYVDENNIDLIRCVVDEAMEINYNAGFALPLISDSLFPSTVPPPSVEKYLLLLVYAYEKYPFYDEVLIPVNLFMKNSLVVSSNSKDIFFRMGQISDCVEKIEPDGFHSQLSNFWTKAFLWQRWVLKQEYDSKK